MAGLRDPLQPHEAAVDEHAGVASVGDGFGHEDLVRLGDFEQPRRDRDDLPEDVVVAVDRLALVDADAHRRQGYAGHPLVAAPALQRGGTLERRRRLVEPHEEPVTLGAHLLAAVLRGQLADGAPVVSHQRRPRVVAELLVGLGAPRQIGEHGDDVPLPRALHRAPGTRPAAPRDQAPEDDGEVHGDGRPPQQPEPDGPEAQRQRVAGGPAVVLEIVDRAGGQQHPHQGDRRAGREVDEGVRHPTTDHGRSVGDAADALPV